MEELEADCLKTGRAYRREGITKRNLLVAAVKQCKLRKKTRSKEF